MRPVTLFITALWFFSTPAFACKNFTQFPEHIWGSTAGWWEPYRVIEVVDVRDEHVVAIVKQNFKDKADVGNRVILRFMSNEKAHAMCARSLNVGSTYLIETMSDTEPLTIRRFGWMIIPSTHPNYDVYLRDLERAEIRPMYVEANTITYDLPNNRVILQGKVELHYNNYILFADQVIDDRNVNELVAKRALLVNPDRTSTRTRSDHLRLPSDYRDTFRSIRIEPRAVPWE